MFQVSEGRVLGEQVYLDGCRQIGMPEHVVRSLDEGVELTFSSLPDAPARPKKVKYLGWILKIREKSWRSCFDSQAPGGKVEMKLSTSTIGQSSVTGKKSHTIDDFGMMTTAHDTSDTSIRRAVACSITLHSVCMVVAAKNLKLYPIYRYG